MTETQNKRACCTVHCRAGCIAVGAARGKRVWRGSKIGMDGRASLWPPFPSFSGQ
uniref:Uncharacterized protein n=1 Tax=Anguilla anguilla TaxID=7936 RepID=A0A0E9VRV3_ANGAN